MIRQTDLSTTFCKKLLPAWNEGKRFLDVCGGTRSGKTFAILQLLILVIANDKTPTINSVCAETMPQLKRGAIRDFQNIMRRAEIWSDANYNKTDCIYTFANGSILEFFSLDSEGKIHGLARDRLFVDEAQNIAWEKVRQLLVRTRGRVIFGYNPTREFWVHTEIQPRPECVSINSTYRDNEFLTAEQVAEIEANKKDARWWRVYGEGLVGAYEGVIYDFEQIDTMPEKGGMVEVYGVDFGFTHDPSVAVRCYIHTGRKEIYCDQLFYRTQMLNSDIVQELKANNVPNNATIIADSAEPKSIEEIRRSGYRNIEGAYKATRLAEQIAHIKQYRIFITKSSVEAIKELRTFVWAQDRDGRQLNEPMKGNDHFADAMRYAVFGTTTGNKGQYRINIA